MKKLFLTSFAYKTLDLIEELLPKQTSELKVAFIPTAADIYDNKDFVNADREKLIQMGFKVMDVDLKEDFLEKKLEAVDLILVAGGNTFYLLDWVRKSGFDKIVERLIDKGVIYIGSSAGSIICCPTIEGASNFDRTDVAPDLASYFGLNFFDEVIIPHANKKKYFQRIKETKMEMEDQGFKVNVLTDNQAIIMNDDSWKVVEIN